jgi:hypothetical protein
MNGSTNSENTRYASPCTIGSSGQCVTAKPSKLLQITERPEL